MCSKFCFNVIEAGLLGIISYTDMQFLWVASFFFMIHLFHLFEKQFIFYNLKSFCSSLYTYWLFSRSERKKFQIAGYQKQRNCICGQWKQRKSARLLINYGSADQRRSSIYSQSVWVSLSGELPLGEWPWQAGCELLCVMCVKMQQMHSQRA